MDRRHTVHDLETVGATRGSIMPRIVSWTWIMTGPRPRRSLETLQLPLHPQICKPKMSTTRASALGDVLLPPQCCRRPPRVPALLSQKTRSQDFPAFLCIQSPDSQLNNRRKSAKRPVRLQPLPRTHRQHRAQRVVKIILGRPLLLHRPTAHEQQTC